jgi:hypothetical protein
MTLPMKRLAPLICALALAALIPAAALGAQAGHGTATGKVTYVGGSTLTIQTAGRLRGLVNALTATANAIGAHVYPYVYGGGHGEAGVPSIGIKGPGYNGRRIGYDCSGSVAAVLAGAGLWAPGSGVPNDAGVIEQLLQERLIARGPGQAPDEVTLYDDPGVHIFMNIDGRFFGTSDGGGGNPKGGPTWLDDGAPDSLSPIYKRYHVLPSVLKNKTSYGHSFTFQTAAYPGIGYGAEPGDKVKVSYAETRSGSMTARTIQYVGAVTTSATVSSIVPGAVTIQTPTGKALTLSTSLVPDLVAGLVAGDGVQVTYSKDPSGLLIPRELEISSVPSVPPPAPSPPVPPVPPSGPSS